ADRAARAGRRASARASPSRVRDADRRRTRAMRALALLAALLTATLADRTVAQRAGVAPAGDVPRIRYERFTLPNGLVAILNENHATPIVAVDVWYHVGSKNETPGRTGFADLFEHMMLEGPENVQPGEYRTIVQSLGGTFNGTTSEDRTNYYTVLPSNHLETALWLES